MRLWRLTRAAHRTLDGEGARLFGGRWNSPGVSIVYGSTSLALAVLETLVHLNPDRLPTDLVACEIDVPDEVRTSTIAPADLPSTWRQFPESPECRALGDAWAAQRTTAILVVPSVILPVADAEERNVLLNPQHTDMRRITSVSVTAFRFDPRLVRR